MRLLFFLATFLVCSSATIYFEEDFGPGWKDRWVVSTNKGEEAGAFITSAGKFFGDEKLDVGLQTSEDSRFYQISAGFPSFSNKKKTLVIQYSVKNEQDIDCGGGYLKILPAIGDQTNFSGDTPYNLMFGPDICGTSRVHAIISYNGTNHLMSKIVPAESDLVSHLYTFILYPNQTYKILIDNGVASEGDIGDHWEIFPPKNINDPSVSKPKDWVEQKYINDPKSVKPEGYDDIQPTIPDPEAKKPEEWDDEEDGTWQPRNITNPKYKGPWYPKQIKNPDYKGPWEHPQIPNSDYFYEDHVYIFERNAFIAFEVWQVKSGTIFDNILVTDDVSEADKRASIILDRFKIERDLRNASLPEPDKEQANEPTDAEAGKQEL